MSKINETAEKERQHYPEKSIKRLIVLRAMTNDHLKLLCVCAGNICKARVDDSSGVVSHTLLHQLSCIYTPPLARFFLRLREVTCRPLTRLVTAPHHLTKREGFHIYISRLINLSAHNSPVGIHLSTVYSCSLSQYVF